jgi:AcrR family transcriptional regulator
MADPAASTATPSRAKGGPKPRFTREEILDAALEIADSEGLAAVQIRSLATRLELSPMALYRYFGDKQEILDAIAGHALNAGNPPGSVEGPWHLGLDASMRGMRAVLCRHPALIELFNARQIDDAELDGLRVRIRETVARSDLSPRQQTNAIRALTAFVLGSASVQVRRKNSEPDVASSDESFEFGLELLMTSIRALENTDRQTGARDEHDRPT